MREARVPAVFSTILKAPPLPSQAPTVALVPEKFSGELTSNVTSGVAAGTFAGIALNGGQISLSHKQKNKSRYFSEPYDA
jgi:hypothetical protein